MNKLAIEGRALASKFSLLKRRQDETTMNSAGSCSHNHPYHSMRLSSIIALALLMLLSIPALALKAYSYSFVESNVEMGFYLMNDENQMAVQGETLVAALPLSLFRIPEKLVLVVAMLNILLSMAHLVFIAWDWKAGKRTQTLVFRRNALVVYAVNAILILIALILTAVSHKFSSTFEANLIPREPNAVSPSGYRYYRYDAGTFDLETWTCELMKPKEIGDARKDYRAQCEIEVAGRLIMVPFFLVALIVTGLSVWALVTGGAPTSRSDHLYTKDMDLEMAKAAENGKHLQVEEVELATLQRQDRQKDGRLSKIEEDSEDVEELAKRVSTVTKVEESEVLPAESEAVDVKKSD